MAEKKEPDVEATARELPEKPVLHARSTRVGPEGAIVDNFDDMLRVATVAFRSRMLPMEIQNVDQAFMIVMTGADLRLKPSAAFKFLYMTKARRVTLNTKGAHAVIYASGVCESYKEFVENEKDRENMVAVATSKRKGFAEPFVKTFSFDDARAAGLLKQRKNQQGDDYDSPYQAYLKDMLLARARGRLFDVAYPDVTCGIPIEGVSEDIDRMEAQRVGRPTEQPAQPALPAAVGPDPFLEALKKGRDEDVIPVEAAVVPAQKRVDPKEASTEQLIDDAQPEDGTAAEPGPEDDDQGELFG